VNYVVDGIKAAHVAKKTADTYSKLPIFRREEDLPNARWRFGMCLPANSLFVSSSEILLKALGFEDEEILDVRKVVGTKTAKEVQGYCVHSRNTNYDITEEKIEWNKWIKSSEMSTEYYEADRHDSSELTSTVIVHVVLLPYTSDGYMTTLTLQKETEITALSLQTNLAYLLRQLNFKNCLEVDFVNFEEEDTGREVELCTIFKPNKNKFPPYTVIFEPQNVESDVYQWTDSEIAIDCKTRLSEPLVLFTLNSKEVGDVPAPESDHPLGIICSRVKPNVFLAKEGVYVSLLGKMGWSGAVYSDEPIEFKNLLSSITLEFQFVDSAYNAIPFPRESKVTASFSILQNEPFAE